MPFNLLLYSSECQSVLDAFGTEDEEWRMKMENEDDCDLDVTDEVLGWSHMCDI